MDQKIFVAGHGGLVGSAICRRLRQAGAGRIVTRAHRTLDLTGQGAVGAFFAEEAVDCVILAAARVGGIHANSTRPAEFIYENLMIQANVIHQAFTAGVRRLLFLGSSCIYPKHAPQPMREEHLLTGPLEPTNAPYAIAKIAGIQLCEAYNRQYGTGYRAVMPTNLYGPNDGFDLENAHVLPALIRKFHLAKLTAAGDAAAVAADEKRFGPIPGAVRSALGMGDGQGQGAEPAVLLWGSGSPLREFLYVDDMADACLFVMNLSDRQFSEATGCHGFPFVNVGCGLDLTIRDLAATVARIVGYDGRIRWDRQRDDGTPRKLMDVSRLSALGWTPAVSLEEGIRRTYDWYRGQA